MGGYAGGALAAELTVQAVTERLAALDRVAERDIEDAFAAANASVRRERAERHEEDRMGATLTLAIPYDGDDWIVAHVGDSPAYLVSRRATEQLTEDHTVTGDLVRQGAISLEDADHHPYRNVLLRAVGAEETIYPDVRHVIVTAGEALVLVSDGVSGVLSPAAIGDIVREASNADEAARALIDASVELRSSDNVTAVVIRRLSEQDAGS
jgi:protein phosphatase